MEAPLSSSVEEIMRLRMALPALRMGSEPSHIASGLLEVLFAIPPVSIAFVRLYDSQDGRLVEMARVAEGLEASTEAHEIGDALVTSMGNDPLKWPPSARVSIGELDFSIASALLGLQGELGVFVAGSQRAGFPGQTEALVLEIAADRAALALLQARFSNENQQIPREQPNRVARRTGELPSSNQESSRQQSSSSEIESRLIVDSIPGLVAVLTATGDVELVSRQLLDYFGRNVEELRQWGTSDAVHPEDLPQVVELFTRSIEAGSPYEIVQRLRRSDGVYRWFQNRGFPLREPDGRIVRWCVLFADIDDQKRAEDAVRASERNLNLIINTMPTLAWSARPDGSVDFINQRWLDYTGLSDGRDWRWTAAIHPEDLSRLTDYWRSILITGEPGEIEARLRRFDGAYRCFLFRANPLRDDLGKIIKWYGVNIDIEDRKRGEELLHSRELSWRHIVDNIPGLVATMGAMGEVEFLNKQTLEYFGKTNAELKNWSLIGAVHPDDLPRVIEARRRAIETGEIYDVEHRCRRADGVYRWFQVRGLPLRNTQGAITDWYLLLTDIDDRKKAEEALKSSEHNLRQVIDAIPALAWCNLPDGPNEFLNKRWHEYTGLSPEQSQGWGWQESFHPEDLPPLMEKWRKMLVSGQPDEIEARLRRHDGIYRWFLIRAEPFWDESGRIVRWYGTSTDIDDRKQAEAELKEACIRLTEAQRLSKTGSFISDVLADKHAWSEEAYRIFEFDPTTKVTQQLVRDIVHPEDLLLFNADVARAMEGMDVDFVIRIVTSLGTVKHVRIFARVFEEHEGRPIFCGALQDVSESKIAEEALRASERNLKLIVNTIPALAWSARADGFAEFFNQHYLDYVGLSAEQARDWGWTAAVHPDDLIDLANTWRRIIASGQPGEAEARLRRHDGECRWFLFRMSPLRDENGNILKWYGINTDIDDRKRSEDLRLEERVNERTRIARELHDTLLQSFQALFLKLSAVKYLMHDRLAEAEEQLDRMVEQAGDAIREGRDAVQGLRLSTITANDVAGAIKTFGEGLASDADSPEFSISVEGKPRDLPPLVRDEVHRIAGEALRNAFRYAGAKRIEVAIHYDNGEFRMRVRDDGKGMDPKVLDAGGRVGHHGLRGMHERAKMAGGELTVRSAVGSGTEIELTVPSALAYIKDSPAREAGAFGHGF